jgi:hypothetical protein
MKLKEALEVKVSKGESGQRYMQCLVCRVEHLLPMKEVDELSSESD